MVAIIMATLSKMVAKELKLNICKSNRDKTVIKMVRDIRLSANLDVNVKQALSVDYALKVP